MPGHPAVSLLQGWLPGQHGKGLTSQPRDNAGWEERRDKHRPRDGR